MKKERAMWMTGTLAGLLTWSLRAQSLWLPAGGGDWDTAANWAPPAVPDGADVTVIVTNNIAADATINLGSSRTVGAVVIADGMGESGSASHKWDFNAAAAQTLTLQRTTGPAVINGISFASHATRKTWPDIRNYLVSQCGMTLAP